MESHVWERSKYQFLACSLNFHSVYELFYQYEKDIEVKVGISSIPVLIWVFINQIKITVKRALSWKMQLLNKTLFEEKYQTHLINKSISCNIGASEKFLSQNNPQSIASLVFDLQKVINVPSGGNCFIILANLLYIT